LVHWTTTANAGDTIALSDLTDFDWDRVLAGQAYYTNGDAVDDLGFAWEAQKLPSYTNDGLNFLAFVAGDQVIAWTTVTRIADIPFPPLGSFVSDKASAVFVWDGNQLVPRFR
jgi:hypothetical protein